MLCFLYNYNYLLQSQSKLTNKLCVFKITMKFIDYNNLMNKRLCGQYLVDNTRFCGRYLVDIFFFRWSIFSKTPLAALHIPHLTISPSRRLTVSPSQSHRHTLSVTPATSAAMLQTPSLCPLRPQRQCCRPKCSFIRREAEDKLRVREAIIRQVKDFL